VSHVLGGAGILVAATAGAAAILLPPGRARAAAMLVALALFPALILGDQWHSHQIADLRDHPTRLVALGLVAVAASAALAAAFRRWPLALPLAIVFALPFRIPLHAGGQTANLLVPLYLVIAGGVLTSALRDWSGRPAGPGAGEGDRVGVPLNFFGGSWSARRGRIAEKVHGAPPPPGPPSDASVSPETPPPTLPAGETSRAATWLPVVLAVVVVLYAVQALYSPDFSKSLQNVCFFFVPFSLAYALLRDVKWSRKLLTLVLWVIAIEGLAFVAVGSIEYLGKSLFWNDQVIRSNEFHTYFRVNSVFWDPNVYGRWLALAIVVAMAALLWARAPRNLALLTALVAILWLGLVPTFSQSSFIALLVGLAVLGALRWSVRWALGGIAAFAVAAVLVVLLAGGASKLSFSRINVDTSGRANLVSGGVHLFAQRPLWGYGSGSFPRAYREHVRTRRVPVSVSHTEPVTVAAEQGAIGLIAYAALIATALWTMGSGLLRPAGAIGGVSDDAGESAGASRPAILAAFIALFVHTLAYAGFFEDPITWVLLAVGASLAAAPAVRAPA
jgi:O-antigen ligase